MFSTSLQKAKSGDITAFGDLYEISYDRVYRFLFHRTLDTTFTEDIISDVYAKALKNMTKFRGESEWEFFSWILSIAYTTLMDHLRYQAPIDRFDEMNWEPMYDEKTAHHIDVRDTLAEVLAYISTLGERDRIIITMRIWDDLSYDEISRITGESVSNAKKIVSRTLEKIAANVHPLVFIASIVSHALFSHIHL